MKRDSAGYASNTLLPPLNVRFDEERFVSSFSQIGAVQDSTGGGDGGPEISMSITAIGDADAGYDEPEFIAKKRRGSFEIDQRLTAIQRSKASTIAAPLESQQKAQEDVRPIEHGRDLFLLRRGIIDGICVFHHFHRFRATRHLDVVDDVASSTSARVWRRCHATSFGKGQQEIANQYSSE